MPASHPVIILERTICFGDQGIAELFAELAQERGRLLHLQFNTRFDAIEAYVVW